MKITLLAALCCFTCVLFSQTDTTNVDRTIEGLHKTSSCIVDTLVTIHVNKELVLNQNSISGYEFKEGTHTYVEVRLRTTVCFCEDCSFAEHVIVDVTDFKAGKEVQLTAKNTTWFSWNSMMMIHAQESFQGEMTFNNQKFDLILFKVLAGKTTVVYDGIKVSR